MRAAATCLAIWPVAVGAQDADTIRLCVEAQQGVSVAACRGAYSGPCLDGGLAQPHQCHESEARLWAAQVRRSLSPLLDQTGPRVFERFRAVNDANAAAEVVCDHLRDRDLVDEIWPGPPFWDCVSDNRAAIVEDVRWFLGMLP